MVATMYCTVFNTHTLGAVCNMYVHASSFSLPPSKRRSDTYRCIPRHKGQSLAPIRPLKYGNTRLSRCAPSDEVSLIRTSELHAADLVQSGVGVADDVELATRVPDDRDGVSSWIPIGTYVTV
jgi:hypothetical protein